MLTKYIPSQFEKKWAEEWKKEEVYKVHKVIKFIKSEKKKFYTLVELPYTSGDLHIGHWFAFTHPDVLSRFKRMNGYNVFFPMGYDAFGLPAENAAIKRSIHPKDWTMKNIETMTAQFQQMGTMIDWDWMTITCLPEYYRWNQWIFSKMFEKGLAYRGKALSNWCPSCQTVLANENIENGKCWRCGSEVIQKEVEQWFLKITDYAERLIWTNHTKVNWPIPVRVGQNNWIGKKEGVIINHKVEGTDINLDTFSAFPAWLFADTFIVLAPEHPLVSKLVLGTKFEKGVADFVNEHKKLTGMEKLEGNFEKRGIFTGKYAIDPFNKGRKMPIWLANFALMDFGTGIIRCSGHDKRDFEFATKYSINIEEVVDRIDKNIPKDAHDNKGILKNSGPFSGKEINEQLIAEMIDWIEKQKIGKRSTSYHIRDWSISRQRYWGTPVPMIHCPDDGIVPVPEKDLPVELPYEVDFTPHGKPPLATNEKWLNVKCPKCGKPAKRDAETLDTFFDSAWYWFRYLNPKFENGPFDQDRAKNLTPVDVYFGGGEHTLGHTLYARFFTKMFKDWGMLGYDEFALQRVQHGIVLGPDGNKMSKSKGNVINPDDVVAEYGSDTARLYLCFMMPYEGTGAWSTQTIAGVNRFLARIWTIFQQYQRSQKTENRKSDDQINQTIRESGISTRSSDLSENKQLVIKLQKTIKKVTEDINNIKMNTSIAAMMEFLNEWEASTNKSKIQMTNDKSNPKFKDENNETMKQLNNGLSVEHAKMFLQILAPFAPFMTEEIWRNVLGEKESIHLSSWPTVSREIVDEEIILPIQVNGKLRSTIKLSNINLTETAVTDMSIKDEKIQKYINGKGYKVIYVPGKILNFIVK